jgi:tRNA A37 methylthiotransferase MiaB
VQSRAQPNAEADAAPLHGGGVPREDPLGARGDPHIALSTDVIVAFPGETDEEYEATLDLMREIRFDEAYMYRYSPRDGTPATRLPAGSSSRTGGAGAPGGLIALQREIQAEINAADGRPVVEVLLEKEARRGGLQGRTGPEQGRELRGARSR